MTRKNSTLDSDGFTDAACTGNFEAVKNYINNGIDVNLNEGYALRGASCYGHINVVRLLLRNKADLSVKDFLPLTLAAREGHFDIVKLLIKKGSEINPSAIRRAKNSGHHNIFEFLTKQTL